MCVKTKVIFYFISVTTLRAVFCVFSGAALLCAFFCRIVHTFFCFAFTIIEIQLCSSSLYVSGLWHPMSWRARTKGWGVKSLLFQFYFVCFIFPIFDTLFSFSHWSQLFCSTLPIGKMAALTTVWNVFWYVFFFFFSRALRTSFKSFKFILVSFRFYSFFFLFSFSFASHISLSHFAFYILFFVFLRFILFSLSLSISYLSMCAQAIFFKTSTSTITTTIHIAQKLTRA